MHLDRDVCCKQLKTRLRYVVVQTTKFAYITIICFLNQCFFANLTVWTPQKVDVLILQRCLYKLSCILFTSGVSLMIKLGAIFWGGLFFLRALRRMSVGILVVLNLIRFKIWMKYPINGLFTVTYSEQFNLSKTVSNRLKCLNVSLQQLKNRRFDTFLFDIVSFRI